MKKVSIIVPIYNAEKYLSFLLDSLVKQTYANKEIILVDDGATDGSRKICDEYALLYEFIKVIHTKNHGLSIARNTGINAATGDYISFVDSDDAVDFDFYKILIDALEKTNSDISCCDFLNEYTNNIHVVENHNNIPKPYIIDERKLCLRSIITKEHSSKGFVWNKVYRKDVIGNLRFREEMLLCEDLCFNCEVLNNSERICITELPMYHYRYVSTSLSKNSKTEKYEKCLKGLEKINNWAKENAPFCLTGLYANYIFWNTKTCETMLNHVDRRVYELVKNNLRRNKEYIQYCSSFRIRILANALMKSWIAYAPLGLFFWNMKKLYIILKKHNVIK